MRAAASRTSARCSTAVDVSRTCGATADSRWTRSSNVSRTVSVASAFMPSHAFQLEHGGLRPACLEQALGLDTSQLDIQQVPLERG